ncbi:MAG: oligosaccharide flippase family protein [Clostridia bacterium]|nr:oligosaccharide flippase family protein [Clostridia bacterium]
MNKTAKNTAIYFAGTVIMALLGFANSMLLTHILDSQVYAMYGLFSTFTTAVITLISFGYDASYTRFYYEHGMTQKKFMWTCVKYPLIVLGIFSIVLFEPSRSLLTLVFGEKLAYKTIIIMFFYILFSFVHRFSQLTARMEERAGNYILSNIVARSGFIILLVVLFFLIKDISFEAVLLSFAIGGLASILINIFVIVKVFNAVPHISGRTTDRGLFRYGFPIMLNNVLVLLIPIVEKIIIRSLAGWEILGIFTATSIFQTVALMILNTVDNIWNPIIYKNIDKPDKLKPMIHTWGLSLTVLLAIGIAFVILLRRWLILLLNRAYYNANIIAPAIFLGGCINFITVIYGVGVNIKKKSIHHLISPIIQIIISVGLSYLLIPRLGLIGIGISSLSSIVVSRGYRMILGIHYYNTGNSEWKSFIILISSIIASVMSMFLTSLYWDIATSILLLVVTLLVANKDLIAIFKLFVSLFFNKKKKQEKN